jgi:hypothetical protein
MRRLQKMHRGGERMTFLSCALTARMPQYGRQPSPRQTNNNLRPHVGGRRKLLFSDDTFDAMIDNYIASGAHPEPTANVAVNPTPPRYGTHLPR